MEESVVGFHAADSRSVEVLSREVGYGVADLVGDEEDVDDGEGQRCSEKRVHDDFEECLERVVHPEEEHEYGHSREDDGDDLRRASHRSSEGGTEGPEGAADDDAGNPDDRT